jgi:hypothetical protein
MKDDYGPDPVRELLLHVVLSICVIVVVLVLGWLLWQGA